MFRHNRDEANRSLSDSERAELISSGKQARGMVARITPCEGAPGRSTIEVQVDIGGQPHRFEEEVDDLYQPESGTPDADRLAGARQSSRHPGRVPKAQMPISAGSKVPVRFDPEDARLITVDLPALRKLAVDWFVEQQRAAGRAATVPSRPGPPWEVPDHCPNCGAPLDQARASVDPDPHCGFCHEPVPVEPRSGG